MRHPLIKYALWLIVLATYTFTTFQFTLLEVAHRMAHLGDAAGHHYFHDHPTVEHSHTDLTNLADVEHPGDSELPATQRDSNQKQPQLITTLALELAAIPIFTTAVFHHPRQALPPAFLKVESPPPDCPPFG